MPKKRKSAAVRTVGIGASAGGVKPLLELFERLPPDLGVAYAVIVHLDPEHQSELASIIGRCTKMPVTQVTENVPLEANHIYVIPPNHRLVISDQQIATLKFEEPRGKRAPIDQFFRSLADQHGDGFAIILSGAGSDGSIGVRAIKEGGGLILVQDPAEAEYSSMPRSAIATGVADVIAPVSKVAEQLVEMIRNQRPLPDPDLIKDDEDALRRILTLLRNKTSHDFSLYKRSTILRRMGRRMQICHVQLLQDYYALLRGNPEEVQALFADLLISVTVFFRDPASFEALTRLVIAPIYDATDPDETIRVWVPGCATGEEAYSIAMLFAEEAGRREIYANLQVFASDLDSAALATARAGLYPVNIEADVGEERLQRFFTREGEYYRVKRELRDIVLFTSHSLIKDPPFSRLDLISCRNLLIYLDRELQQQVCTTFHYALKPERYLFLGTSESAELPPGLFKMLDREARIFQSTAVGSEVRKLLPNLVFSPRQLALNEDPALAPERLTDRGQVMHQRALEELAPPSILVDRNYRVIHLSETAGRYIRPSAGHLSNDVTELVLSELRFDLRAGLRSALEKGKSDLSLPIPVAWNGDRKRIYLQVWPIKGTSDRPEQALILFMEGSALTPESAEQIDENDRSTSDRIISLQEELELARSRLRSSRQESETANEELRAANEELQSINEEYRSTAEELETSKEELQSINEELQTVNNELKIKLETVSQTNNDLQNLMAATDVGILFLDAELRIKLFTPPLTKLFNITTNDQGRPITDFTNHLDYPSFAEDARSVLRDLTPIEREVSSGGSWFLTRVRTYRTVDDHIDGLVVTFIDITRRLASEEKRRKSEARARLLLEELSHRVKNTLALVQSITKLSFADQAISSDSLAAFSGRLAALSCANELLVDNDWAGVTLSKLIEKQLAADISGRKGRVQIDGPDVMLPPDLVNPLALALHELGTNAVKYGSLSNPDGTLSLNWRREGDDRLTLIWREQGVQPPKETHQEEFGTFLIEKGVPGAKVKRVFENGGMTCTLACRLPKPAV